MRFPLHQLLSQAGESLGAQALYPGFQGRVGWAWMQSTVPSLCPEMASLPNQGGPTSLLTCPRPAWRCGRREAPEAGPSSGHRGAAWACQGCGCGGGLLGNWLRDLVTAAWQRRLPPLPPSPPPWPLASQEALWVSCDLCLPLDLGWEL